jgi:hypothetical protein
MITPGPFGRSLSSAAVIHACDGCAWIGNRNPARAIQDQLFQTGGADPAIYLPVVVLLVVVAVLATLTPTWRALRENPHDALRAE